MAKTNLITPASAPARAAERDDESQSYYVSTEALFEIGSIAALMLKCDELDSYQCRALGIRLQELANVAHIAVDNAREESATWDSLLARLKGVSNTP